MRSPASSSPLAEPPPAGRPEHRPGRPHGRRGHVRQRAARGLPHPRELPARAAQRAASSSTWRTSSCGRPRSSTSWPPSSATRPATHSASSSCCRAGPTTAKTTPAASSAGWSPPTTATTGCSPRRCARAAARRTDPLYVHAKVGIVDDRWLTIGSANLNAHSLLNDTEMNVVTDDAELARDTRERLWAEHLELHLDDVRGRDAARARRRALDPDRASSSSSASARTPGHPPADRAARRLQAQRAPARPADRTGRRRLRTNQMSSRCNPPTNPGAHLGLSTQCPVRRDQPSCNPPWQRVPPR